MSLRPRAPRPLLAFTPTTHTATLVLALLALLLTASASHAATAHVPGPTFQLQALAPETGPTFLAVDKSTGSVYVEFRGEQEWAIEKFTAAGAPSNFSALGTNVLKPSCQTSCSQIAIDNSGGPNQGYIYLGNFSSSAVTVYAPSGTLVGTITSRSLLSTSGHANEGAACGVAVDKNGDLIVAHQDYRLDFSYLDKLEVTDWATHPSQDPPVLGTMRSDFTELCRTAIDSSGVVYAMPSNGEVRRWEPDGFGTYEVGASDVPESLSRESTSADPGPASGIAVDGEDNLWVTRVFGSGEGVRKLDSSGSLIESLGAGELVEPWGVAVNPATGTVYVGDAQETGGVKSIHIFTAVVVPDSLTGQFTATGQTQGTLSAEVKTAGAGTITSCKLEYTTADTYSASEFSGASTVPCEPGNPPINGTKSIVREISGLSVEEPYVFRVRTENVNGASNGAIHSFIPHAVIELKTKPATEVGPRSAKLSASFTGNGEATEYWFEYGPQKGEYTQKSTVQSAGSPPGAAEVSLSQSELELETTYHFRAVAKNGNAKTSFAEDRTFTTPPAVAGVKTTAAGAPEENGITLSGEFTGNGLPTEYLFEYGLTKAYGLTSKTFSSGSPTGPSAVSGVIDEYEGFKTYHYRIVAKNTFGDTVGQDVTFETPPAPLPVIQSTSVGEVEPTAARLSAQVNPNRWPTIYLFEWGPTTNYGNSTGLEHTLGGLGNEFLPVSLPATGLTPGVTYHFRTVAINFTGVTDGPDQTFMTPGPPLVVSTSLGAAGETTASLSASVVANGRPTSVHFEYGTSAAFGSRTASVSIGSDSVARETPAQITGLTPGTTYHVRVKAENSVGEVAGEEVTITTGGSTARPESKKRKTCPKGKVKRHGKCVKKAKLHPKKHHPKAQSGNGNG